MQKFAICVYFHGKHLLKYLCIFTFIVWMVFVESVWDHWSRAYTKISEKLNFLAPGYAHVHLIYQRVRNFGFRKIFSHALNEWPLWVFILQALQYLRKVSNHPSLVLKPTHPEYQEISANLQQAKSSISDIQHSGKLVALRWGCLKRSIQRRTKENLWNTAFKKIEVIWCVKNSVFHKFNWTIHKQFVSFKEYSALS